MKSISKFVAFAVFSIGTIGSGSSANAQACGWYAIGGCYKSWDSADQQSRFLKAPVVDTNTVPNFRNGWFCVAAGPTSKGQARSWRNEFRGKGVGDAYIKKSC